MPTPLHALLVEDSEEDALLLERHLARAGYTLGGRRVDSYDALREALASPWELVIADYNLPGFTALDALAEFRKCGQDIPFIIVSGAMGEDVGVHAMLCGAHDYIFKGNLSRLVPAIERELREAVARRERRAADEALRRSQEQLRHAQKLEAMGRLAGGVAHDFNNILSIVGTYASLLLETSPTDERRVEWLTEIQRATRRATELTRQLLTFSRGHPSESHAVDLDAAIGALRPMLERMLGEDVRVEFAPGGGLAPVRGSAGQIEQIVMNLAINARDAMPEGGALTIATCAEPPGPSGASRVRLTVRDTGTGMTPEVLAHLFEPFFTTKDVGKGTGLGLATVYGIVHTWGGDVLVESAPGQGTTFHVLLPVETVRAAEPTEETERPSIGGAETLLVVEDDDAVREVVCTVLGRHGYTVLAARDADEALSRLDAADGAVSLVVTDVVMPRMSGRALADVVARRLPGVPIVFLSGFADWRFDTDDLPPGSRLVTKPFTIEGFTRVVREALDGARRRRRAL